LKEFLAAVTVVKKNMESESLKTQLPLETKCQIKDTAMTLHYSTHTKTVRCWDFDCKKGKGQVKFCNTYSWRVEKRGRGEHVGTLAEEST